MKKLFLIPILLITNHLFGQLSVSLHHYDYYDFSAIKKNIKSTVSVYVKQDIGSSFKFTSFSLVNNKWGESLIGLEYSPFKWLSLEGEVGIETNIESYGYRRNLIRRAELVTVVTNKFVFLGTFEQGSLNWFDLRMFYMLKQTGIGAMASQYYGLGPIVLYHIGKSRFKVWSSMLYNWDNSDYGTMIGIYYRM